MCVHIYIYIYLQHTYNNDSRVPTDESTKKHTNTTPNFSINYYSRVLYTSIHIHSHHIRIINITIFLCVYHTIKYKHTKNRLHIHHHRKLSSTFPGILESLTTQPWENFVIENDSKMRIAAVRLSKDGMYGCSYVYPSIHTPKLGMGEWIQQKKNTKHREHTEWRSRKKTHCHTIAKCCVWVWLWRNRYRWRAFTEILQLGATRGTD